MTNFNNYSKKSITDNRFRHYLRSSHKKKNVNINFTDFKFVASNLVLMFHPFYIS